jgi:hypothetical protein
MSRITKKFINSESSTSGQMLTSDGAGKASWVSSIANFKDPCRCTPITNINITSAPATISGVSMSVGDRVLLWFQTDSRNNGIWIWNGYLSVMTRSTDCDTSAKISGMITTVLAGSNYAGSTFQIANLSPVLGTDYLTINLQPVPWHQQGVDTLTQTGALNGQALVWNTAGNAWTPTTVAGAGPTSYVASVAVNFGARGDLVMVTVPVSWIQSTTGLMFTILPNILDHDPEDVLLEGLICTYSNIIAATSFDLYVHAPQGTWGRYTIKAIGV